ncbi:MAG: TonB family protein [Capsulimonadales bacterium]|nr:TonB family protein [Capsulimonadales bacterium]
MIGRIFTLLCAAFLLAAPVLPVRAQDAAPNAARLPAAADETHPLAVLETGKGRIVIELYPNDAPITVNNFVQLAKKGFYNGLTFHRVVPNFVIQGGDPQGNGTGGPGYEIKNEANRILKHDRGAVAMANAGRDTAGSQFYIVINRPAYFLDEKDPDGVNKYTLFGKVLQGQEVAERIEVGDKMKKVTIVEPRLRSARPTDQGGLENGATVEIKVTIEADGTHTESIVKSCGNADTDKAILAWIGAWKWEPAQQDGKPVRSERTVKIAVGPVK